MAMFLIIIVIAFIVLFAYAGISSGNRSRNAELMVKSDNFTCSKEFKSVDSKQYVAFDKDASKVLIANISTSDTKKKVVDNFYVSKFDREKFSFYMYDENRHKLLISNNVKKGEEFSLNIPYVRTFENFNLTKAELLKETSDACFYAIDEQNKVIIVANLSQNNCSQFNLDDIIKMELLEDNSTVFKKSLVGTIGRSIVGGVLAGGVGAVIGGTTGKSSVNKTPESIVVKFYLKDTQNPSFTFVILDSHKCSKSDKIKFAPNARIFAMGLCDTITSYKAQQEDNKGESTSNIDLLTKLADLKEKGLLTEEEFNTEKKKLLGI